MSFLKFNAFNFCNSNCNVIACGKKCQILYFYTSYTINVSEGKNPKMIQTDRYH